MSWTASGRLDSGASKLRCQMGEMKIRLDKGSSVRITAHSTMGDVSIDGAFGDGAVSRSGGEVTIGAGAATLDIEVHDGHDPGGPGVTSSKALRRPPLNCPVCNEKLALTRLTCPSCSTELSGGFSTCEFCVLSDEDRDVLRVFLASRGNMKDLERHLGVSYPTARARFDSLLSKIGIERPAAPVPSRMELMEQVARGEIDIDEALSRLDT